MRALSLRGLATFCGSMYRGTNNGNSYQVAHYRKFLPGMIQQPIIITYDSTSHRRREKKTTVMAFVAHWWFSQRSRQRQSFSRDNQQCLCVAIVDCAMNVSQKRDTHRNTGVHDTTRGTGMLIPFPFPFPLASHQYTTTHNRHNTDTHDAVHFFQELP